MENELNVLEEVILFQDCLLQFIQIINLLLVGELSLVVFEIAYQF